MHQAADTLVNSVKRELEASFGALSKQGVFLHRAQWQLSQVLAQALGNARIFQPACAGFFYFAERAQAGTRLQSADVLRG